MTREPVQTCLQRCIVCGQWVAERTQPHNDYVCSVCLLQGHGLDAEIRRLEHDIARMRAQLNQPEGEA
jgi:hypothetical protein